MQRASRRPAHELCGGRWLACGGGGNDVYGVVPRHWALLWAEMAGKLVPAGVPDAWRARWQSVARAALPQRFRDGSSIIASP